MNKKKDEKKWGVSDATDKFILSIGHFLAWANGILIIVIVLQVTLRYGFGRGLVILEELEWHLYSLAFMFGLSYALVTNAHVRVDLIHSRFSKRTQEWIEILGTLFILMPFIVAVIVYGTEFFVDSWVHSERSSAPIGLPYRWIIKAVIPISFFMFALAGLSRLIRAVNFLRRNENGSR
jgi:TRAP-type mannitol/chloroaromatic compound transport system permease small subunit